MSAFCDNSACFSVEIKTTSDISVTFMFYNGAVNKEKTAAGQTDFSCLYFSPCGGFKRLKPPFFIPPKNDAVTLAGAAVDRRQPP